jgi:hypothetical protein
MNQSIEPGPVYGFEIFKLDALVLRYRDIIVAGIYPAIRDELMTTFYNSGI